MKMTAARSGWPTREIALLIADASPELRTGTDPMSVVVSGATTSEIPSPNSSTAGRMSTRVETGGMSSLDARPPRLARDRDAGVPEQRAAP